MDRSFLHVYRIRVAVVSPTTLRKRKPPVSDIFLMKGEDDTFIRADESIMQSLKGADFDENFENNLGVYESLFREGKNVTVLGTSSCNASNSDANQKPSSSNNKAGATKPKTKPKKKTTKEAKKQRVVSSRVKTPKNETPPAVKTVLRSSQTSTASAPVLSFLSSLSAKPLKGRCNPEALQYKQDFKNKKMELCEKLFQLYNREVFDNKLPQENLVMTWSKRLNKSAAFTHNTRVAKTGETKDRISTIIFSTKVCDTADRVRDILIHELCHAACWLVDEVKNGHGSRWKFWAKKAMRMFPELPVINRCHDYQIFFKYSYKCTRCGYVVGRHSKSLDVATKCCGFCYGVFELFANTKGASGAVSQRKVRKRSRRAFSSLVKDNRKTQD